MNEMIKRYEYIDNAKLIGIFLVILGHINIYPVFFVNFIYTFHMPLFFFLSGLTQKDESRQITLIKSLRGILIPYIVFYFITYVWWIFVGFLPHPELYKRSIIDLIYKPLLGLLFGVGYNTKYSIMINAPLWFLPCLFLCKILYSCTRCNRSSKTFFINIYLSFIFITLAYFISINNLFIPLSLSCLFMVYPFFVSGIFLSKQINCFLENKTRRKLFYMIFLIGFTFILICLITLKNGRVDVNTLIYGKNLLLFYIGAFLGIVFILSISYIVYIPKKFGIFSKNTIVILAFHTILLKLIYIPFKLIYNDFSDNSVNIIMAILIALMCLLFNYIPIKLIINFFPFVIGKKKTN